MPGSTTLTMGPLTVGTGNGAIVVVTPGATAIVVADTVVGTVVGTEVADTVATAGGPEGIGQEKMVCVGASIEVVTGTVDVVTEDEDDDGMVVLTGTMVATVGPVSVRGNAPLTTCATQSVPGRYKRT